MIVRIALAALVLTACSREEPAVPTAAATANTTTAPVTPVLSWAGYGPVIFGSSLAAVEQAVGPRSNAERPVEASCDYVAFATLPGVRFMVENGVVTRADAEREIANVVDIDLGTSLAEVIAAHPDVRITPHKYDEGGHYLIFPSPDQRSAIVMEASSEKIVQIRAGLEPAVEYVEGCL